MIHTFSNSLPSWHQHCTTGKESHKKKHYSTLSGKSLSELVNAMTKHSVLPPHNPVPATVVQPLGEIKCLSQVEPTVSPTVCLEENQNAITMFLGC